MKIKDVFNILDKFYSFDSQDEWDRSGISTIDFLNDKLNNVFIALDISEELILEAISQNVNLIISHHPLYIDELDNKKVFVKKIEKLLKVNRISIISCHTNFDKNKHGMNYHLCKKMRLKSLKRIDNNEYIYFGDFLKAKSISDIINLLKKNFNLEYVILPTSIELDKKIKRVAICGGAGSSFINDIKKKYKIDLYITSEIKWNYWNNKNNNELILCDVPHHIEKEFIVIIYNLLTSHFNNENNKFKIYENRKINLF
ncbi:MAG: Nif3-like dinuclear metal center hexameric protein [Malacoplasma sp.]